ncbi:MAG: formyltransferase family protein [Syntrophales bacterium]
MAPRIGFAGDRDISVKILDFILSQDVKPLVLLIPEPSKASHDVELVSRCYFLPPNHILAGTDFRSSRGLSLLQQLELDFIIGIHFPYIVPTSVLSIPKHGVLNLHPAFLPYNRGWHTPTWAILENTPIGASLHFMDAGIDTGDIIHQKQMAIFPGDTAHSLYVKLKELEYDVFREAWPQLLSLNISRKPQLTEKTSTHNRKDIFEEKVQRINLEEKVVARKLMQRLRALTTDRLDEAAYYEENGKRYRIQLSIHEELGENE